METNTEETPLEERLKPCPFCGVLPDYFDDDGVLMVQCLNNECPLSDLWAISAAAWETRSSL